MARRCPGDGGILAGEVGTTGTGLLMFGPTTSPDMIGIGVHADVHDLAFSNDGNRLWTSCDGGVYRSDDPATIAGFRACNDGLSIIESNYVASHPTCEGYVVTGLQDNGIIERASTGVWRHTGDGDGGGVAFDPLQPDRFVRQYHSGSWVVSDGSADDSPLSRCGAVPSAADDEAGKLERVLLHDGRGAPRAPRHPADARGSAAHRYQPPLVQPGHGHDVGDAADGHGSAGRLVQRQPGRLR